MIRQAVQLSNRNGLVTINYLDTFSQLLNCSYTGLDALSPNLVLESLHNTISYNSKY